MSNQPLSMLLVLCVVAVLGALIGLPDSVPAQEEGRSFELAIPSDVTIVPGNHLVIVTGLGNALSPVNCTAGTPQPTSAVIVDPSGGTAAQRSGVLIYTPWSEAVSLPPGTRLRIATPGTPCNSELRLYMGTVE